MACLHPIRIKNPTRSYCRGINPVYLTVPCGKCEECRKAKHSEWALRTYIQVQDVINNGGFALFPTLTYRNEDLPHFEHLDENDGSIYDIPCFDHDDIKAFMKSLRKRFERKGIVGIKHLICSEYGPRTQRPHYHALIMFPSGCDVNEAVKAIEKAWLYGFVGWSKTGKVIESFAGCRYVSKYVTKDVDFFERKDLNHFLAKYRKDKDKMELIKSSLPKHWQSQHFGESLVNIIKNSTDGFEILDNGYRIPCTETILPIPNYIRNKLLYTYNDEHIRSTNQYGQLYSIHSFELRIKRTAETLQEQLSVEGLKKYIKDDASVKEAIPIVSNFTHINSLKGLSDYLHQLLGNVHIYDFAIYKSLVRDYVLPSSDVFDSIRFTDSYAEYKKHSQHLLEDYDSDLYIDGLPLIDYARHLLYLRTHYNIDGFGSDFIGYDEKGWFFDEDGEMLKEEDIRLINYDIRFENLNCILKILDDIQRYGIKNKSVRRAHKDRDIKKLKEYFIA